MASTADRRDFPIAEPSPDGGAVFMRPFALGATAYLLTLNFLYVATRGTLQMPDRFSELYLVMLGCYGGAPEIKRWMRRQEPIHADGWQERLRKGGPIITLWILLYALCVTWRLADSTRPLPPELKTITMGVIGLFFGTYSLRQFRQRVRRASTQAGERDSGAAEDTELRAQITAFLKARGSATAGTLEEFLQIPRRSLNRLLKEMEGEGRVVREGRYRTDPSGLYRLV